MSMRIDKFLKTARILKRREAAKELALQGRVLINGRKAKPGSEVEIGDIVDLQFGNRNLKIEVKDLAKQASKANAALLFEILEETRTGSQLPDLDQKPEAGEDQSLFLKEKTDSKGLEL